MTMITSLSYIQMERIVEWNQQRNIQKKESLKLFEDRITTSTKQLPIDAILDISYKSTSTDYGVLYLHTNRGVFSYQLMTSPNIFIMEFKKLKGRY